MHLVSSGISPAPKQIGYSFINTKQSTTRHLTKAQIGCGPTLKSGLQSHPCLIVIGVTFMHVLMIPFNSTLWPDAGFVAVLISSFLLRAVEYLLASDRGEMKQQSPSDVEKNDATSTNSPDFATPRRSEGRLEVCCFSKVRFGRFHNTHHAQRYINLASVINFGVVILASWESFAVTFQFALINGGPASIFYGSILAGLGACVVGLSLAELASMYELSAPF